MTGKYENLDVIDNELAYLVPHCPVMLVLDASHSMWGQGQYDEQQSIIAFFNRVKSEAFREAQIDIAAVKMGDDLRMLAPFTPIAQSTLPGMEIRPKGDTPLGGALTLALQELDKQVADYKAHGISCVTPQLIVLSDGKSGDDYSVAATEIRTRVTQNKLICHAIALGNSPDCNTLHEFAGNSVMTPQHGNLPKAFSEIGHIVSQTYESSTEDAIQATMVPSAKPSGSRYLLDGTNIIYWEKKQNPSMTPVLQIVDYMKRNNEEYTVYFDASTRHVLRKKAPAELTIFESLLNKDPEHFRVVPAHTRADEFLLFEGDQNPGSIILTNDCFRDYAEQYPWVKDEKRVAHGMSMNDSIFFPRINLKIS